MINLLAFAVLFAPSGTGPSEVAAALVVEGQKLPMHEATARAKLALPDLDKRLRGAGYSVTVSKGVSYYFAESIWQGKKIAEATSMYSNLLSAIRPDGSIDLTKDPVLGDFVEERLAGLGYQMPPDGQVALDVDRSVTMQVGGRSVTLRTSPTTSATMAQAARGAFQQIDPGKAQSLRGRSTLIFDKTESNYFYAYGTTASVRPRAEAAYLRATEILDAHWKQFWATRLPKLQGVLDRLTGYSLPGLYGTGFSGLPPDLQASLRSSIGMNYQSYGFGSQEDAMDALSQGILTGSSATLHVNAGHTSGGMGVGFGLP